VVDWESAEPVEPPDDLARTLWGVRFRSPLGNAAGMFKNGHGYSLVARQGAGYYLAGTTTAEPRTGNRRAGVRLPFAPYPRSGAASNWLGLPNEGHAAVAERLAGVVRAERVDGCPVGASLASVTSGACPGSERQRGRSGLQGLLDGLAHYADAGVDFLEINESCPNTEQAAGAGPAGIEDEWNALRRRLETIAEGFLAPRQRRPPVLVKFSLDTEHAQVGPLVDLLLELGFDGIDLGNTSTRYPDHRGAIDARERPLYDHFTGRFGGGVSGRPLREISLGLAGAAVEHVRRLAPDREFHVLRTGGIETGADLAASERAGVALDGWYTGSFQAFAEHGHGLYREIYREALEALHQA
jgi:dihydroorotate dehydrogenase